MIKISKNRSPLIIFRKEDRFSMKYPTQEAQCAEGIFQIQTPICGVNFSNNISIPQVRVKKRETELDSTFETF